MTTDTKSALVELAERCEAAEGPDRELDIELFRELGPINEDHCKQWCRMDGRTDLTRDRYIAAWAPSFTASVDAAMTLVPEGWHWSVGAGPGRRGWAALGLPNDTSFGSSDDEVCCDDAATPALALCAASLRARAISEQAQ